MLTWHVLETTIDLWLYNLMHLQHNHQHDQIMYRQISREKGQTNVRCWKPYTEDANMAVMCIWETRLACMYLMRLQYGTDIIMVLK